MMDTRFARYAVLWIGMGLLMIGSSPLSAQAEWMLSLYGGIAYTLDSDVAVRETGGTDLTFHDVTWDDDSFKEPLSTLAYV